MAQASHAVQIPASQEQVWAFVSKVEKWAALVPAYKEHKEVDAQTSHWTFEGNFKGLSRKIQLEIKTVDMIEPSRIQFEINGLSDNVKGGGEFTAVPKDGGTYMTATVEVTAGGLSGAVLNPAIKMLLPKVTARLTEKIARHIQV